MRWNEIVFCMVMIVVCLLATLFFYKLIFYKPSDDGRSFVESLVCYNKTCMVNFTYDVIYVNGVIGSGSDSPVVGANDKIVCLDVPLEEIRVGDLAIGQYYLHFIEEKGDGWVTTRGSNNWVSDGFRQSTESIKCVVGMVGR